MLIIDWMLLIVGGWVTLGLAGIAAPRNTPFVARVLFPLGAALGAVLALAAASDGSKAGAAR